jgi:hypothetical protein
MHITPATKANLGSGHLEGRMGGRFGAADRHSSYLSAWCELAVLSTEHDEPKDWLIAGQALRAVLLAATQTGLSASFLYQIMEGDDMRDPHPRSWPWPENVQTIIRLGYPTAEVPVTPRRSTADLLQSGEALRIG